MYVVYERTHRSTPSGQSIEEWQYRRSFDIELEANQWVDDRLPADSPRVFAIVPRADVGLPSPEVLRLHMIAHVDARLSAERGDIDL